MKLRLARTPIVATAAIEVARRDITVPREDQRVQSVRFVGALRRLLAIVITIVLVGGVVGTSAAGTESSAATAKPVLRVGLSIDLSNLNPAAISQAGSAIATTYSLAYEPIFHMTPNGSIKSGLATSWRYFDTGTGRHKGFEFKLRRNARFSDGTRVTAQAVASWLRYFSKAPGAFALGLGPNPRFQAVGRWTVRMRLTVPSPNLPAFLSDAGRNWAFVAAPRAVADPTRFATGSYGAGQYMLDASRSVRGDHYAYVPNPYYHNKEAVKFSRVEVKIITNPSSMLQALQSGQLDVAQGQVATAAAAASSGLTVAWASSHQTLLALNTKLAPELADVRVRQALNYAIDRKTIAQALLGRYSRPVSQLVTTDADPNVGNDYSFSPARARSLLAAAGFRNGLTLKTLTYSYLGVIGDPIVQAAAKYLDDVGIRLEITAAPVPGDWVAKQPTFPVFQNSTLISTTPRLYETMLNPQSRYKVFGSDGAIDRLYYLGLKSADPVKRWKEMWARVATQAYYVPLVTTPSFFYATKAIKGLLVTKARLSTPFVSEWSPR